MGRELSYEEECWVRLSLLTTLSVPEILRLIQQTGSVEDFFDAGMGTLVRLAGEVAAREIRAVSSSGEVERIKDWLSKTEGVNFLTLADPAYPLLLVESGRAPVLLWYRGGLEALSKPVLTVGGSTHPDREALYNADTFGRALGACEKLTVSTGFYSGTEATFLKNALAAGRASCMVWQPCGPDRIWPSEGRAFLHELLAGGGLILTAVPPGRSASQEGRNLQTSLRVASAHALLALNASRTSHLLTMARWAADWGRDVMAVPGSIHSPFSKGCHQLIKQGAKLVESTEDVLTELKLSSG